jgi:translation initiation factor IF-2
LVPYSRGKQILNTPLGRAYTDDIGSGKEESIMPEVEVGHVSDFFAHPVVAGIDLSDTLKLGDRLHIVGHTTDLEMVVESMQVDNADVSEASAGQAIGVKVPDRVRRGDQVYKVID